MRQQVSELKSTVPKWRLLEECVCVSHRPNDIPQRARNAVSELCGIKPFALLKASEQFSDLRIVRRDLSDYQSKAKDLAPVVVIKLTTLAATPVIAGPRRFGQYVFILQKSP